MPRVEIRVGGVSHKIKKIKLTKKLRQEVFPVDHCAVMNFLFHCAQKAPIATTREQSVIVTSKLVNILNHSEQWRDKMWIYVS